MSNRNPRTAIDYKLFAKVRQYQRDGKTTVEIEGLTDLCKSSINTIRQAETWTAWTKRKERKNAAKRLMKRAAAVAAEVKAEETIPAVSALDQELENIKRKQRTLERAVRTVKADQASLLKENQQLKRDLDSAEAAFDDIFTRLGTLQTFHTNVRSSKKLSKLIDKGVAKRARANWSEL